jgi:hypothetical protein
MMLRYHTNFGDEIRIYTLDENGEKMKNVGAD